MKIQLTKQECLWLADLVNKAKVQADMAHQQTPNRLFLLRRDNMADLETKLNAARRFRKKYKKTGVARDEFTGAYPVWRER